MAKQISKLETSTMLDKNRSLFIERITFATKGREPKYWIKIENSITNSVFRLPALTREDLQKLIDNVDSLDKFAKESGY